MTATGLVASVEIAHEARSQRVGPATGDGAATLRVVTGDPVRVVVLLGRAPQLARTASAAALASGAELAGVLGVADGHTFVERALTVRDARPDLVLVLAPDRGDAGRLVDLAEALRFGCAGQYPVPHVLLSADQRALARIAPAFAPHPVESLPDARTAAGREALVARLRAVRRRARNDVALRDEALEATARRLAASSGAGTVVLDVTGTTTSLVHASPAGVLTAVHGRLGVGAAADRVVARAGLDRVRRWIPRAIETPALLERVFNRARWPDAAPAALLSLTLEMALAREAIARTLADAERAGIASEPFRVAPRIVLTGRLAELPRAAQAVLVALDGLEPVGVSVVSRGSAALVADGALASRGASAAPSVEAPGATMPEALALVAPLWPRRSATVRVWDAGSTTEERVGRGAFLLVPTSGPVDVTAKGASLRARSDPLALGVVIDARGRPLALPPRDAERVPTLGRWFGALDALPREART